MARLPCCCCRCSRASASRVVPRAANPGRLERLDGALRRLRGVLSDGCQSWAQAVAGPGERQASVQFGEFRLGPFLLPDGLRCVARRFASVASSIHRSAA
ncbi:hypothetical protein ACPA9J_27965 [Pseudomonas aeruginosa]